MVGQGTLSDREMEQFEVTSDWAKHRAMQKQAGYNAVDREFNGLCYFCNRNRFVRVSAAMLCRECVVKKDWVTILGIVKPIPRSKCVNCGKWKQNTAEFTVRSCARCKLRVGRVYKDSNALGVQDDPFFQRLRKRQGKDWEWISGFHTVRSSDNDVNARFEELRKRFRK